MSLAGSEKILIVMSRFVDDAESFETRSNILAVQICSRVFEISVTIPSLHLLESSVCSPFLGHFEDSYKKIMTNFSCVEFSAE